jgi:tetratricopeptide (TPR) repeat protein
MTFRVFVLMSLAAAYTLGQEEALEQVAKELRSGEVTKAMAGLREIINKDPKETHARYLLAETLLDQDHFEEAGEVARQGISIDPKCAELLQASGDVAFRKGLLVDAEKAYTQALESDEKNVWAIYGKGRVAEALSLNQRAQVLFGLAHRMAPHDSSIMGRFTRFAASNEEQGAALTKYMASVNPDERRRLQWLNARLEVRKFLAGRKAWAMTSPYEPVQLEMRMLLRDPTHIYGVGLPVSLNGEKQKMLMVDTGSSGLTISRSIAEKANLERIADVDVAGIGDKGDPTGYLAFAKSVRVGKVTFENCIVHVSDKNSVGESAGLIGTDVFERYLITFDFRVSQIRLDLLPGPLWDGEAAVDRYRGPELKGFAPVLRTGGHLLVSTQIDDGPPRLFLIDTGATASFISTNAAGDVTKVRRDPNIKVKGISGAVSDVRSADKVVLVFAGFRQVNEGLTAVDMTAISRGEGMEVAGVLGLPLLRLLRITLDYRDGVVKFERAD